MVLSKDLRYYRHVSILSHLFGDISLLLPQCLECMGTLRIQSIPGRWVPSELLFRFARAGTRLDRLTEKLHYGFHFPVAACAGSGEYKMFAIGRTAIGYYNRHCINAIPYTVTYTIGNTGGYGGHGGNIYGNYGGYRSHGKV